MPPPPQEVILRITSAPGAPVKDADLLFDGNAVAKTGDDGVGRLKLTGKDGDRYEVTVRCPEGFLSPSKPQPVLLRRLADPTKTPEYDVTCPPTTRTVVVAVRADGGPKLPVLFLGHEVARTDGSGAAHVLLKLKADEAFDLVIGTEGSDRLRPQNPSASFVVKDRDEVFVFDQHFDLEKKKVVSGPARHGPVKITK